MATVNIGGDQRDPNYRYKMPKMVTKIEGRGNGIKTVVVNMEAIARALHRHPEIITKFFGFELGAQSRYDPKNGQGTVNGCHDLPKMTKHLDIFINLFVLCSNCGLPETDAVLRKGIVHFKCNACGHQQLADAKHKLTDFLAKHDSVKTKTSKSTVEGNRPKALSGDLPPTSPKSESEKIGDKAGSDGGSGDGSENEEGMEGPEIDGNEIADNRGTVVFRKLINAGNLAQVLNFIPDIKKELADSGDTIPSDSQVGFLIGLEELATTNESLIGSVPGFMQLLYNEDVVEEEAFQTWRNYNAKSEGVIKAAQPFLDWLNEAEEEDDE